MATNYPSGYDSLNNPAASDPLDSSGTPHSSQHTNANDAIEAIQATLGLSPQGSYTTVSERIYEMGNESSVAAAAASAAAAADSESAAAASATSAASSAASVDATATTATEFRQFAADGSVLSNLPARVHPAEQLLKQAVWWIDAAHSSAGGQTIKNLGWGGSVLDARSGSTTGADSNDPKFLPWEGENYVYLPGVAGNYLSVPDEAGTGGDIDIRMEVSNVNWDGSAFAVTKTSVFEFRHIYGSIRGGLYLQWWNDAGVSNTRESTVGIQTVLSGTDRAWIRATLDVDNGAGGHDVKFYYSTDGVAWTQLGSTVTTSGTTTVRTTAATQTVGISSGAYWAVGKLHRAIVKNGIDGTPVLDVDCSQITSGSDTSFTALTGQTVTINRSTSGRKTVGVVHPRWLFGTDDYMEVPARWVDAPSGGLYLPGVSGNYASTPDSAAVSVTGDITIDCYAAAQDWTPSAEGVLASKWLATGNQRSYSLVSRPGGGLALYWSTSGSDVVYADSTVGAGLTDGSAKWVRATLDVDNSASGYDVKFWLSDDGVSWTQLGATVTGGAATSIYDGTALLNVGAYNAGTGWLFNGTVYRARIYASADGSGSPVFDADFTGQAALATTFTEDSTNSATVTINTSGSGYVATLVPASGYVQPTGVANFQPSSYSLLDFGASDSFTVLAVVRGWATQPSYGVILAKRQTTPTSLGYSLDNNSTSLRVRGIIKGSSETNLSPSPGPSAGDNIVVYMSRDAVAPLTTLGDGTSTSTSATAQGDLANTVPLRVGRQADSTSYNDMEFTAAAIWRRALTSGEIATLNSYFQGRA